MLRPVETSLWEHGRFANKWKCDPVLPGLTKTVKGNVRETQAMNSQVARLVFMSLGTLKPEGVILACVILANR